MKFIELFAGIGGFRYGLESVNEMELGRCGQEKDKLETTMSDSISKPDKRQLAYSCVYTNEFNKYAASIYERHYGNNKETQEERNKTSRTDSPVSNGEPSTYRGSKPTYGCVDTRDIREVDASEIPDHDLLTGGFPCQSFSVAGKRGGFKDTRGTLFFEVARIAKQKQPRLLLLENVKGLLSHDKGKTFGTILNTLDELGYDCQWQVLNSKDFGVPQNRERVFIVGHLRGTSRPEVFPIGGTNTKDIIVSGVLDTETWRKRHEQIRRVHSPDGISPTIPTGTGGGVMTKIGIPTSKEGNAHALDSNYWKGIRNVEKHTRTQVTDGIKVRRLTPTECERLQGFPDGWTEGVSDTQRYKCLGNAVTTNVVTAIGERLL